MNRMYFLFGAVFLCLCLGAANAQPDRERELQNRLNEVYEELGELEEHARLHPSGEIEERMEMLLHEARAMEEQLQRLHHEPPEEPGIEHEPEIPGEEMPRVEERMRKFHDNMRERERQLREIEERMQDAAPEEWERLERERAVLEQDLQRMENVGHKFQQFRQRFQQGRGQHGRQGRGPGQRPERPHHGRQGQWERGPQGQQGGHMRNYRNPKMQQEVLQKLQEKYPEIHAHLKRIQEQDPQKFQRHLMRTMKEVMMLERLKQKNPDLYEFKVKEKNLNCKTTELVAEIQQLEGEDRELKRSELREILNQTFELREKERLLEVERLTRQAQELQEQIQGRRENMEIIVEQHLQRLLGEGDEWEW